MAAILLAERPPVSKPVADNGRSALYSPPTGAPDAARPDPFHGAVAQLGERLGRIEEVVSSNLICSTSPPPGRSGGLLFFGQNEVTSA